VPASGAPSSSSQPRASIPPGAFAPLR
jgi:hypothetical protein